MPEADRDPASRSEHRPLGVDKALGHLVQAQVPRRQAEEMAGFQGTQLVLSVANSFVFRKH